MMLHLIVFSIITALFAKSCDGACNETAACFPPLGNLTLGRNISVTSSCVDGEIFTFLSETLICNSTLYSPSMINDDDIATSWVSGVHNNLELPFVIQLDFESPVLFYSSMMTWASRTPAAMSLQRNDGSNWIPYRYYSNDCTIDYNLTTSLIRPGMVFANEDPVCTDLGLQITPNAEITFTTSSHNVSGDRNTYEYIYGLKIVVDRIEENSFHENISEVLSISEWVAMGTCMCYGHAEMCSPSAGETIYNGNKVYSGCSCSHNTVGDNCEQCDSGYNDRQWLPGNETDANECQVCQCSGHDCYYNVTLAAPTCICLNNTAGNNCSICQSTYYPGSSIPETTINYCIDCDCNKVGVIDDGECSNDGVCNCKPLVTSAKCSECKDGYWNFSEANPDVCQPCDCGEGSEVCDIINGECECLSDLVIGDKCDMCEEGTYDLQQGCNKNCTCDPVGSIDTIQCNVIDGQCDCKDNITGINCEEVERGYYYKSLDDITLEAEDTETNLTVVSSMNAETFSGSGYLLIPSTGGTVTFITEVSFTSDYFIVLRYQATMEISEVSVSIDGQESFRLTLLPLDTSEPNLDYFNETNSTTITFEKGVQYSISISYEPVGSGSEWMLDSIVIFPDITNTSFFTSLDELEQDTVLMSCLPFSLPVPRNNDCDMRMFQFSLEIYGTVFPCDCSVDGTVSDICNNMTSNCLCKESNTGTQCSDCNSGYYRNINSNTTECQACDCNPEASIETECNVITGQCNCTEGAIGLQCMECPDTHYITTTSDQDYCMECFCFNHSSSCTGVDGTHNLITISNNFMTNGTHCLTNDWVFENLKPTNCISQLDGVLYSLLEEGGVLIAPESYHGDFALSYGRSLNLVFTIGESAELSLGNSFIRISNLQTALYAPFPSPSTVGDKTYTFTVPFLETQWRVGNVSGDEPSLMEFIHVLSNITDFRFTGGITNIQSDTITLNSVSWNYLNSASNVSISSSDSITLTIENCTCPEGHTGQFCGECVEGYYRTVDNVVATCIQCECNGRANTCSTPTGICDCINSEGDRCENCSLGYFPDPIGSACLEEKTCDDCNPEASECNVITGQCHCTEGAIGLQCMECPDTHYITTTSDQNYCMECFCFNHSSDCTGVDGTHNLITISNNFITNGTHCMTNDWVFENLEPTNCISQHDGVLYTIMEEGGVLIAPESYHGDFALSYGRSLSLVFTIGNPPAELSIGNSFIRISNIQTALYAPFPSPSTVEDKTYTFIVPFLETQWRVGNVSGDEASLVEFIHVLSNITDFRFTGGITNIVFDTITLNSVSWDYLKSASNVSISSSDSITLTIENCNCPEGHTGQFCEECVEGYYRTVDNFVATCIQCECNGRANTCSTPTGICDCINSEGDRCENCSLGYFPDPIGTACLEETTCDDCNPEASECNVTTGQCNCTEGAIGLQCMECPDTHYITTTSDQDYCMECFCFSHTSNCTGVNGTHNLITISNNFMTNGTHCLTNDWVFENLEPIFCISQHDGVLYTIMEEGGVLIAPESYHGDFALSYGRSLSLVFTIGNPPAELSLGNSFIKISNLQTALYAPFPLPSTVEDKTYKFTVPFLETQWRVGNVSGDEASLVEFIHVLSNITDFRFTGGITNIVFDTITLNSVSWDYLNSASNVSISSSDSITLTIENCNCPEGHTGQFCEECVEGYYRTVDNVVATCIQCECNGRANTCSTPTGICDCINSESDRCENCSLGYFPDPIGTACLEEKTCDDCNPEASECNVITGQCDCTEGAIGLQCMECPDTHYITTTSDQDYCMECFCFNHSSDCTGVDGTHNLTAIEDDFEASFDVDEVCNSRNWTMLPPADCILNPNGFMYITYGQDISIVAPESYHGNLKLSYGQSLTIVFILNDEYDPNHNSYIRISNGALQLYSRFPIPLSMDLVGPEIKHTFMVPFEESYWRVGSVDGNVASLRDLIDVLVNVTDFRFSGTFTDDLLQFNTLNLVRWEYLHDVNVEPTADSTSLTVEYCTCPNGHEGQFCEDCMDGYYRMDDSLVESCILCDCNGRADTCDTHTGTCINCTNNSIGDYCESCLPGYYHNGMNCTPCDCDGQSCDANGTCINCTVGYRGLQCDTCENGYYNNSGSCEACDCSGNVNVSNDLYCDPRTGECLNCTNNFQGFHCNMCENGYYTNNTESCQVCNCSIDGSLPNICDNTTGTCLCNDDNATPDCSECIAGFYGNIALNETCAKCPCPSASNSHALSCSVTDGNVTCVCDDQYTGTNCDECRDGYFGDPLTGECVECDCSGSLCDKTTGLCDQCTEFTNGDRCEGCINGYYGDPRGNIPCIPCSYCSNNGTIPEKCEMRHGSCFCKDNVFGDNCTECIKGTYGVPDLGITCQVCPCENIDNPICHLSDDMETPICDNCGPAYQGDLCQLCSNDYYNDTESDTCTSCQCNGNVDPSEGRVCDINNGVCTNCLYNTTGPNCEQCTVGYYGDAVNEYCQACDCNMNGTTPEVCDSSTGDCFCTPSTNASSKCNNCSPGYWGSQCVLCDCCSNGSMSMECNQTNGQCECLPGVGGAQCCECEVGYYNFKENEGCSACNCGDLAKSIACNSTGHCDCKDGASGMKCNVCDEYGYIGDASNCSRCHDCFFNWDNILSELNRDVIVLLARLRLAMDFYSGYNQESVKNVTESIQQAINATDQTLGMLSLDTETLNDIGQNLHMVNVVYDALKQDVDNLMNSFNQAEQQLENVTIFLSETSFEEIDGISNSLITLSMTIGALKTQATINYETIEKNQMKISAFQSIVDSLKKNVSIANDGLSLASNTSEYSINLKQMATNITSELSEVNSVLMKAEQRVGDFQSGLIKGQIDMNEIINEIDMLDATLEAFNAQLLSISLLSQKLENSTTTIKRDADSIYEDVKKFMELSNDTLSTAEALMIKIGLSQSKASSVASNFSTVQEQAFQIDQIDTPSTHKANQIAAAINNTVIPKEEVDSIIADANRSAIAAQEYLSKAINSRQEVSNLEGLVTSIKSNLTTVNDTLAETIYQDFMDASNDIIETEAHLNKIDQDLSRVSNIQESISDVDDQVASGNNALNSLMSTAETVETDSKAINDSIANETVVIQSEAEVLDQLIEDASSKHAATSNLLKRASSAENSATQSKNDVTNSPPMLADLSVLLAAYKTSLNEVKDAKTKIASLNEELDGLIASFNDASTKYKNCYKTP